MLRMSDKQEIYHRWMRAIDSFEAHGKHIPVHCRDGLARYLTYGTIPGNFLCAVLTNDLGRACAAADLENQQALFTYVSFLYNQTPSTCWGSEQKFNKWVDDHHQ